MAEKLKKFYLSVTVHTGRMIRSFDGAPSSPYCRLGIRNQHLKTSTCPINPNPEWNETLIFPNPIRQIHLLSLDLQVFHRRSVVSDTLLGEAEFPLEGVVVERPLSETIHIHSYTPTSSIDAGSLDITVLISPNKDFLKSHPVTNFSLNDSNRLSYEAYAPPNEIRDVYSGVNMNHIVTASPIEDAPSNTLYCDPIYNTGSISPVTSNQGVQKGLHPQSQGNSHPYDHKAPQMEIPAEAQQSSYHTYEDYIQALRNAEVENFSNQGANTYVPPPPPIYTEPEVFSTENMARERRRARRRKWKKRCWRFLIVLGTILCCILVLLSWGGTV